MSLSTTYETELVIDLIDEKILLTQYGLLIDLPRWAEE